MAIRKLMTRLFKHLSKNKKVLFKAQHRDAKHKNQFSLRGSFKVGSGSTANEHMQHVRRNNRNFVKHNYKNAGVYIESVEAQVTNKKINEDQYRAYRLATLIFKKVLKRIDPDYMNSHYIINFSLMNSKTHYVKKHVDNKDVAPQYAFCLGSYTGAELKCYDEVGYGTSICNWRKVVKLDGRLPHEVVNMDSFTGNRYSVIVYKTYDASQTEADPIFPKAEIVWG